MGKFYTLILYLYNECIKIKYKYSNLLISKDFLYKIIDIIILNRYTSVIKIVSLVNEVDLMLNRKLKKLIHWWLYVSNGCYFSWWLWIFYTNNF